MPRTPRYDFSKGKSRKGSAAGSAMVEYVLPAGIIIVGLGLLTSATDINGKLAQYFMTANGDSGASLSNGVYKATALGVGVTAGAAQGNGSGNFTASGGSGGFAPGIGSVSSGVAQNSTPVQTPDQVASLLDNAKGPMDVYNAVKDTSLPSELKGMIQAIAQSKTGSSTASSMNTLSKSLMMFAANPKNSSKINSSGKKVSQALNKALQTKGFLPTLSSSQLSNYSTALSANGIDSQAVASGTATLDQTAQAQLLVSLGLQDAQLSQQMLSNLSNSGSNSFTDLQSAANNNGASSNTSGGTCANTSVCNATANQLATETKTTLTTLQTALLPSQATAGGAVTTTAGTTTGTTATTTTSSTSATTTPTTP